MLGIIVVVVIIIIIVIKLNRKSLGHQYKQGE
jgi:hypothetical protein